MNSKTRNRELVIFAGCHRSGRDAFHSVPLSENDHERGETRPYPRQGERLSSIWWLCALCVGVGAIPIQAEEAGHHHEHKHRVAQKSAASTVATNTAATQAKFELPPLPKDVSELKFSEFFVRPSGPVGWS